MSFERNCRVCNCDGWIDDRHDICPICSGNGHIIMLGEKSDYNVCRPCTGDGWIDNRHDICGACNGKGLLEKS